MHIRLGRIDKNLKVAIQLEIFWHSYECSRTSKGIHVGSLQMEPIISKSIAAEFVCRLGEWDDMSIDSGIRFWVAN